ncbi:GT-D fold domain-containing glycosyltransferase [Lachnospiraceae bacterium C1.1]|nr:GT-D fold domain-containing glycosyltransferase [Lachnospiraceae bacterium C1.1]
MNVLIWAAGENALNIKNCFRDDVYVTAYIENDPLRWNTIFDGHNIVSANQIKECTYNYIIISTPNYHDIVEQIVAMGIDREKIIIPFDINQNERKLMRKIFHLGELLSYINSQRMLSMNYIINNLKYEIVDDIEKNNLKRPTIKSVKETLEMLKKGYSMSRYGDGELNMILGRNFSTFQEPDMRLIERLKEILVSNLDNHIVCLTDFYGSFEGMNDEFKNWFRRHLYNNGRELDYEILDLNKVYYNTYITRPYYDYKRKDKAFETFNGLKEIWKKRDLTIIEGYKTRFGVNNDLLSGAKSVERILCPAINAFEKYDEILVKANSIDKSRIVLISLGQSATVLAYDLARNGYQALDIGHLDIEYEWFLRRTDKKISIPGKYVNEVPLGRVVDEEIADLQYNSQITEKIF